MNRRVTNELLEACESGTLSWESVARECLNAMSEDEVADMELSKELFSEDSEEDECPECVEKGYDDPSECSFCQSEATQCLLS